VEGKGYKRMINLPDCQNMDDTLTEHENRNKAGRFPPEKKPWMVIQKDYPGGFGRAGSRHVVACKTAVTGVQIRTSDMPGNQCSTTRCRENPACMRNGLRKNLRRTLFVVAGPGRGNPE